MNAYGLLLAIPGQIGHNGCCVDYSALLEAAPAMRRKRGGETVLESAEKARMEELVGRGRAGDLTAMESLYEMFKGPVFGLVYRYAQNRAAAEDLLQDVFLKVFSHIVNVRDAAAFPAWVYRIALNASYSHLRQKRVQTEKLVPMGDLEGRIEEQGAEPVERDLRGPLEAAIHALAPQLRSVFVLHDVQGFKHEEIAKTLGCAVGTSKSQLFKARIKVREFLKVRKAI